MVAINRANLAGPGAGKNQIALTGSQDLIAVIIKQRRANPQERPGCRTRLECRGSGHGRYHHAAGFCLPPGVYHRASTIACNTVVPVPGFGVDGFSHGSEYPETGAGSLMNRLIAPGHQGTDSCGSGIEDTDLVAVNDLPDPRSVGPVWQTFIHECCGAVGKRPINNVGMPGDPAYISATPVNIPVVVIEYIMEGDGGVEQITRQCCVIRLWVYQWSRRCKG